MVYPLLLLIVFGYFIYHRLKSIYDRGDPMLYPYYHRSTIVHASGEVERLQKDFMVILKKLEKTAEGSEGYERLKKTTNYY